MPLGICPDPGWGMSAMSNEANDTFRIDGMTVKNFRGFEERAFGFPKQFNLLIGDNASGKTAVLDALAVGLTRIPECLRGQSGLGHSLGDDHVRQALDPASGFLALSPQYPADVSWSATWRGQRLAWNLEMHHGTGSGGDQRDLAAECDRVNQALQRGEQIALPLIAYYPAERSWPSVKAQDPSTYEPGPRTVGYRHCMQPQTSSQEFAEWFKTMEWASYQDRHEDPALAALKNAVKANLGNCADVAHSVREGEVVVAFTNGPTLPFRLLSHGVKLMLAMVADIAWRAYLLNPHLEGSAPGGTSGIVLIDEIDLHLHPSWQRRVVDDLKRAFPKVQFIATTHSPFIIQSLRPGELYDLGSPDGEPRDGYADQSIEDIADKVQGVEQSAVSENRRKMIEAGRRYYKLLAQGDDANPAERERLKRELDQIAAIFSDNVAYHAQLAVMESDRQAHGLGKDDR